MKRLLTILLLTCAWNTHAQVNLVHNPSFEDHTQCPTFSNPDDEIRYANYWSPVDTLDTDPICSPEYCNVCAETNSADAVPRGQIYYQYPRTGNGMVQVEMFCDELGAPVFGYRRDYLQGQLTQPLVAGQTYCVTFYVVVEEYGSTYAINHIGAYLDNGAIDSIGSAECAAPLTQFTPQIVENDVISDTFNWVKVEGSFMAQGGERFITIGNFSDTANTTHVPIDGNFPIPGVPNWSYYLVDDVSVIESDLPAFAGNDTAIVLGDSINIGRPNEIGLECVWYINGVAIDSGAGIKVKPDTTTTYVVAQTLCGSTLYDTVKVTVGPVNVRPLDKLGMTKVFPNPSKNEINIEGAANCQAVLYNVVEQNVLQTTIVSSKQKIDIHTLPNGVYILQLTDANQNKKSIRVTKQ